MPHRPHEQALRESQTFALRSVPLLRPLGWLGQGWRDLWRCPMSSLLQGAALAALGLLLLGLGGQSFGWVAAACSAFLLGAPALATGFYASSRALEQGQRVSLGTVLQAWARSDARLWRFSALLALAGAGWILCSAALMRGWGPAPLNSWQDFVQHIVLSNSSPLFELWLLIGAVLAAPVFASSVVALPALLDHPPATLSMAGAVYTSWRVVLEHPAPLALWAVLILALTLLGMASAMLGLIIILPWLGHASWHAYRDLVSRAHPD